MAGGRWNPLAVVFLAAFAMVSADLGRHLTGDERPETGYLWLAAAAAAVLAIGKAIWEARSDDDGPQDPDLDTIRRVIRRGEPVPEYRLAARAIEELDRVAPRQNNHVGHVTYLLLLTAAVTALAITYLEDDRSALAAATLVGLAALLTQAAIQEHRRRRAEVTRRSAEQMLAMAPASARPADRPTKTGPFAKAKLYLGIGDQE